MQRRTQAGQILAFPIHPPIAADPQLRSLNKTLQLLGEIRDDLHALESEWSARWNVRVRKLRAEVGWKCKLHDVRS